MFGHSGGPGPGGRVSGLCCLCAVRVRAGRPGGQLFRGRVSGCVRAGRVWVVWPVVRVAVRGSSLGGRAVWVVVRLVGGRVVVCRFGGIQMDTRDGVVRVSRLPEDAGFRVEVGKGPYLEPCAVVEDLDHLPSGVMNRIAKASAVKVYLSSCGLKRVPSWVFDLTKLVWLDMHGNELTGLPPGICGLTELTHLFVSRNALTALPEVSGLGKLVWLDMHGNELTGLPPGICGLTELTHLFVSRNRLTGLPLEIGQLTNLTCLGLVRNDLGTLPLEIGRLTKLAWLGVSGCGLSSGVVAEVRQLVPSRCVVDR